MNMLNGLTTCQLQKQASCIICDNPLTYPELLLQKNGEELVCRSHVCRNMLSKKSCMTPVQFKTHVQFQRKLHQERLAREARQKQRINDLTEKERNEHAEVLRYVLKNHPAIESSNIRLLVIPSGHSRSGPTTIERISSYTQHLQNIISQAADHGNAEEVVFDQHHEAYEKLASVNQRFANNPALHHLSNQLCTLCKGGCCTSGKDHAYLSVITIRRQMDNQPDLTQQDILQKYLSHINAETIEDSCINQTRNGCALPRELRSDICNAYYCDSLKQYQITYATETTPGTVLAIQRASTHWEKFDLDVNNEITHVALISENTHQTVPYPENILSDLLQT